MKWDDLRQSNNVEDVRGGFSGARAGGVGFGGLVLALILSAVFGVNPLQVLNFLQGGQITTSQPQQTEPKNDRDVAFVRSILGDTEDTWNRIFAQQLKADYPEPKLVLFSGGVRSGCGTAETASGPFYCPADQKVYLDMGFFQQVRATAGPNADFARAYAIAHEVGHYVQDVLGVSDKVRSLQSSSSKSVSNALSVRLELQADCFAGIWGHYTAQRGLVQSQDIQTALDTAAQIGDDYLQQQARGHVVPESFTHGSSQQRVNWFSRGLKTGDLNQCDTFEARKL